MKYDRKRIKTPDGDFIDLDFNRCDSETLLVLMHGLEGSSQSKYILGMSAMANKLGMDAVSVNLKGCSGEENLLPTSYHSGKTDDLHEVFSWIVKNCSYKKLLLVGFSLGGNISLKYVGEYADRLPVELEAAAVVSVPCRLEESAYELAKRSNRIYMDRFLKTMQAKAFSKIEKHGLDFSKEKIKTARNFIDFDNAYTAPVHGFKDAFDYWEKSSSRQFIPQIKIPVLMINATNDPFLAPACFPHEEAKGSEYFHLLAPDFGGHVGFANRFPFTEPFWHEGEIFGFFERTLGI